MINKTKEISVNKQLNDENIASYQHNTCDKRSNSFGDDWTLFLHVLLNSTANQTTEKKTHFRQLIIY